MIRIAQICARGGSKGVPGKNIRPLLGKPLIAHTIRQAKSCGLFAAVSVSSDSEEILEVSRKWGADFAVRRPADLAADETPKIRAMRHCAGETERLLGKAARTVVDLDATSPLRTAGDIAGAVRMLEERGVSNVLTGAPARRSPYFNLVETDARGVARLCKPPAVPVARRQDCPRCYDMNASIYVWKREALLKDDDRMFREDTLFYVMPEERSWDVDSELDFEIVEMIAKKRGGL